MNGIDRRSDGVTVVEGTEIPTSDIVDLFLGGRSIDDISFDDHPDLTVDQIEQALRFECCRTCKCDDCAWARELATEPPGTNR